MNADFLDWRLTIEIDDCGLAPKSSIDSLNRQSTISKSTLANPQSAIDLASDSEGDEFLSGAAAFAPRVQLD